MSLLLTLGYAFFSWPWLVYPLGILLTLGLTIFFWRSGGFGLVGAILLAILFYALKEGSFLIFLFKHLLPALVLSIGLKYKRSPGLTICLAVIPHLVILGLIAVHYSDIAFLFKFQLQEIATEIAGQARTFGLGAPSLEEKAFSLGGLLVQLVFGFQLLSSLFEVFLVYLLIQLISQRLGWDMKKIAPFHLWRGGQILGWSLLLSLVLFLVGGKLFEMISKNLLLVFGFCYAILGFSVSEWFLKKLKVTCLFKILFYFFILITQVFSFVLLSLVGFFDSWLDFRKTIQKSY